MTQKTIELGELNSHLQEVREGVVLMIRDRGRPVAWLVPIADQQGQEPQDLPSLPPGLSIDERVRRLVDAGIVSWSGQRLSPEVPRVPLRGSKTVSEIILEDRD